MRPCTMAVLAVNNGTIYTCAVVVVLLQLLVIRSHDHAVALLLALSHVLSHLALHVAWAADV